MQDTTKLKEVPRMQDKATLTNLIREGRPDLDDATIELWVKYLSQLKGCSVQSVIAQSVDEEAWLGERTKGIGGSEIAAIAGRSPWNTAYQVWMNKTGQIAQADRAPQSEAARWGNLLETTVAAEWAKRNNTHYINIPVILHDDEHPFMFANIDGFTLSADLELITGILEVKTTSAYNNDIWEFGPLPEYYLCQANWYTRITGLPGACARSQEGSTELNKRSKCIRL
jgi:putative phage-type endonuclease